MPEHVYEQIKPANGNPQQDQQTQQHPSQPLEVQPDGTWILGRGADRWMPTQNQIGDLRWVVERDLRKELGLPPKWAEDKEKIEFHKRQLALLDLAKQAPRCEHVFSDGRCCKAPRVKKGKLCYAHTLMEEKRPLELNLPPLEDANAVMLWLMDVLRGLAEGRFSEKTAGLMFYGLQLAMVNARFTTFRDTNHAEMVRTAPKLKTGTKPQRTQRNTKETDEGPFERTHSPGVGARALPQRTQRNTEQESSGDFTAEGAKAAKKEEQRELTTATAKSEEKALPQRTQRTTKEESQDKGRAPQVESNLEPQNAESIPGVESAKSLFFGVEAGEGVADNRPVSPPSEPPRKSSQSEVLLVPKDVEHHLRR